jgi:1,4-alpha-glucan branching enzyme
MPITEFDYHESWGYNPVHHWGPENAYGSPEDLKYMIDVLHQNGIAVLLDIVYNHFSDSGNELWNYDTDHCYFEVDASGDPVVRTPWGSQADFRDLQVREYFVHNILYWLEEYHVDGFRMDATRYMRANWVFPDGYAQGWSLMQWINDVIDARKADAISIAEELPNDTAITRPTGSAGAGFDSQWHDLFNDDVRQELFDAASPGGNPELWKVRNAINDSAYSEKTKLVRYLESHDEGDDARLAVILDSGDPYSVWAKGWTKVGQGLTILTPGIPMFLQGGEWMETTPFGSGWGNRINWDLADDHAPILLFFRDVISVRKSNCGLRSDKPFVVHHYNEGNNVLGMRRWHEVDGIPVNDLVIVASFNSGNLTNYRVGFPQDGTWFEILNSQALDYEGNGWGNGGSVTAEAIGYDNMPYSAELTVPQMGLLVFRHEDPPGRSPDFDGDGDVDLGDFAELQRSVGTYGCGAETDLDEDGRVNADDYGVLYDNLTGPN